MIKLFIRRFSLACTLFNITMKGSGLHMVDVYTTLIIVGRRTLASVPARLQEAVKANLTAMGLDENGNPIEA